jgi:hypothetical protein
VPLFTLRGMQPGDPPVDRCIAVRASGGSALRLLVSGTVAGSLLAADMRMEVAAGQGTAPGDGHSCAGFVPERELWAGALADFPAVGAPAVDDAPLPSGTTRVYCFRVELPLGATGAGGAQATQDIRWAAELEPDPAHRTEGASAAGGRPGRCAAVLGDFPRRTFVVAGRRVTLLLGPVRLIAADTPLGLRVKSPAPSAPGTRRGVPGAVTRRVVVALAVCAAVSVGGGVALAAFTDSTANSGSSFAAAATFPVLSVSIPDVEQTAQVGAQMRVTNGVWSPTPAAFTYGWLRCNTSGGSCVSIAGATAATYTPVAADVGFTLRGAVTPTGGPALSTEATQVVKAANLGPSSQAALSSTRSPRTCRRSRARPKSARSSPPPTGRGREPR